MLTVLSPAKTLHFERSAEGLPTTLPRLQEDVELLLERCRELSVGTLKELMKLSDPLAELNHRRFQEMRLPLTPANAKPCGLAFGGDVYRGLDAGSLSRADLEWAQDRLRILSGLYGVLRPLDLIQPYRLEMGTRLANERGKNLYEFWGDRIAEALNEESASAGAPVLLNLASNEYFRSVRPAALQLPVATAVFQELRNGKPRIISFSAKRARGLMARFIIRNRIEAPEGLKDFAVEGYRYRPEMSEPSRLVFLRPRNWADLGS